MDNLIEKARVQLVIREPFYAVMLQKCIFSWSEAVPTAGVRVNNEGNVELVANKKFFGELSEGHRVGLLMHEMLHLLMDHLRRGKDLDKRIANIAMDIAINQYIPSELLPPGALLPSQFKLKPGLFFEEYYIELMQKAEKIEVTITTLDDHSYGDQPGQSGGGDGQEPQPGHGLSPEMAAQAVASMIEQAAKETKDTYPGNMPAHVERYLKELGKSKTDWRRELRKFIGRNISDHKESTRTRANRRFGLAAPGNKRDYVPKVMIACDQSGSVHDAMAEMLLGEAKKILEAVSEKTEVVFFDTSIAKVELLTAATVPSKRYANGGTDFNCAFEYAKTKRPDLLIMLTDGEASMPDKPGFPVFWVVAGNSSWDHLVGAKVRIEEAS